MSRHPRQRVVVGGIDLAERFGLDLLDGYTLSPPAPKVYSVDVPGGDGSIDVTEALAGDVAYSNRQMSLEFLVRRPADFEAVKTAVAGFLHGRRFDFTLSWDPGYTYTGRFSVDEWYASAHHGVLKVDVDAEPYKLAGHRRVRAAAGGGVAASLPCGRKRQCPTVECARECVVAWDGGQARLAPGRWRVAGLWLSQGANEVWADSAPGGGDRTVGSLLAAGTVAQALGAGRVGDLMWEERPPDDEAAAVYFEYDVKEL